MCFLPVKDWGLKKPAIQMRMWGGEPHRLRAAPSPRQERSSVPRPQKQTRKKAKDMQLGRRGRGFLAAVGTRSRLEHSFPKGEHHLSGLELLACWGHRGALIWCLGRTAFPIKAGKWFQTHATPFKSGGSTLTVEVKVLPGAFKTSRWASALSKHSW